jgi:hypothetical protein
LFRLVPIAASAALLQRVSSRAMYFPNESNGSGAPAPVVCRSAVARRACIFVVTYKREVQFRGTAPKGCPPTDPELSLHHRHFSPLTARVRGA